MHKYRLEFKKPAKKDIQRIDQVSQRRLIKKIKFFMSQPDPLAFAKPLAGKREGNYRWRVGVYRIVFDVEVDAIIILRVQHRWEVFRR
jgi:mRNA interferase RelE/StbE